MMERDDFLRRLEDLSERCERADILTSTAFLTPAEQTLATAFAARTRCGFRLDGGHPDCERKVLFFLPDYDVNYADELRAVRFSCAFGAPEHRDYLGALLASGIRREWLGDLWVQDGACTVFCLPSVCEHLAQVTQIGRYSVRAEALALCDVPAPVFERQPVTFSVQSLRFDAILADLFHVSRGTAVKLIASGAASLNGAPCLKADASIKPGDILSLRGYGKGAVCSLGGTSRKGRQFVQAELYK